MHFRIALSTGAIPPAANGLLDSPIRPCYPLPNAAHPVIAFMKLYHGRRTQHGCAVDVEEDGECSCLHPRHDLRRHSSEFSWGVAGSGPAQLALALAADVLGDDDRAQAIYQKLKFRLIGRLPHEEWVISEGQVRSAIEAIEQERGSPSR